jgi:rhodanese-related sulfurtransferase
MEVEVRQAYDAQQAGALLIDVREPSEWEAGHASGAISLPMSELGTRLNEIPADQQVYFICRTGSRSGYLSDALNQRNYHAVNVIGGSLEWVAEGLPFTTDDGSEPTVI